MGGVIFSQIKSLIGRTFILAGLLPAALLIIGYYLYQSGAAGIFQLVSEFTLAGTKPSADLNMLMLVWLVLGVLFVSFRSVILYFIVELPGSLLKPFRYRLEVHMLEKRKIAFQRKEASLFAKTALEWHQDKNQDQQPFYDPKFIAPFIAVPEKQPALEASAIARRVIEYLMDDRYCPYHIPNRWQFNAIRRGLCDLYAFGSANARDSDYRKEISLWKSLTQDDVVREILQHVSNTIQREHAVALKIYSSFPQDAWIKPTQVGNLMSALDDYSEKRYGIDTATLWTRLWWILSDSERKEIMSAKFQVELLLNHMASIMLILVAVIINGMLSMFNVKLVPSAMSLWDIAAFIVIMIVLIVLLYRGSVFAFLTLKDKTISLIDLNRHQLLKKLGYIPADVKEETELFQELHTFFVRGDSRNAERKIQFNVPEEKSATDSDADMDTDKNKDKKKVKDKKAAPETVAE